MYRQEFGSLFRIGLPLIFAQLAQNTLSFVDTLMVGKLGERELAGIAIGATMFHFVLLIFTGIIYAVSPIVSQAIGAKKPELIPSAVRHGFWVSVVVFIPAFIIYWNAAPILRMLGQEEHVIEMSSAYLRAISFGMLPALLTVSLRGLLEGTSNTRPIMVISLIGVGLNIIANDALMFGHYGLPKLGLVGTGVASTLVYTAIFLMTLFYTLRKHDSMNLFAGIMKPEREMIREILKVGGPISLTLMFESSMFAACSFAMGVIGAKQLAAHQIALQTASVTFMIPLGLALATSVRVGQFAGQGDSQRAKIAGQVGMISAVLAMTLSAFAFWFAPRTIVSWYLDIADPANQEVINYAISFLGIAALFQLFDGLQVSASNSLRGLKETKAAMTWTLVAYWLIGIPTCVALAFWMGLGGRGLWYGLTIGLGVAGFLLAIRFHWEFVRKKPIS